MNGKSHFVKVRADRALYNSAFKWIVKFWQEHDCYSTYVECSVTKDAFYLWHRGGNEPLPTEVIAKAEDVFPGLVEVCSA